MLKILRQIGSIWKKNLPSNIIVFVMICLSCYLGSGVFNQIMIVYGDYNYFKDTPLNRSLLFLGRETTRILTEDEERPFYLAADTEIMKNMAALAENSGIVKGASCFLELGMKLSEDETALAIVYDEISAAYLKNTADLDGDWIFENEKTDDGCYPVVVYNGDHNIGDVLDVEMSLHATIQPLHRRIPDKEVSVKARVVGKAHSFDPFVFYLGVIKSNAPSDQDVRNTFSMSHDESSTYFFFPYDDELFGDYAYSHDTALFYFSDEASDEQIDAFYKEAEDLGYCGLGSDLMDYTKDYADSVFKKNFFVYLSILGLAFTSIICISFLNVKKLKKDFSVYYLNGCSFFRSTIIYFIYFLSLYALPFIASMLISEILKHTTREIFYYSDYRFVVITCLLGLLISAVSPVIPFIIIKHKSPIQNIKES